MRARKVLLSSEFIYEKSTTSAKMKKGGNYIRKGDKVKRGKNESSNCREGNFLNSFNAGPRGFAYFFPKLEILMARAVTLEELGSKRAASSKFQTSNLPCAQLAPGKYRSTVRTSLILSDPPACRQSSIRGSKVTNNI